MKHSEPFSLAKSARAWAIAMTQQPSVTGTQGEADFAPWLADQLHACASFNNRASVAIVPVASGDPRACVIMLLRGSGRRTVV